MRSFAAFLMLASVCALPFIPPAESDAKPRKLTPAEVVSTMPECTPEDSTDCYVIDRNGELYVL